MKTVTVKELRWGKKSLITITTSADDVTGVETVKVDIKRGRRSTHNTIERELATGKLLRMDGYPVPEPDDERLYAKTTRIAADLLNDLSKRDPNAEPPTRRTTTKRVRKPAKT